MRLFLLIVLQFFNLKAYSFFLDDECTLTFKSSKESIYDTVVKREGDCPKKTISYEFKKDHRDRYSYLVKVEDESLYMTEIFKEMKASGVEKISGNYVKGKSSGDYFFFSDCIEIIDGEKVVRNCREEKIKKQLIYKLADGIEGIKSISKKIIEVRFKY